MKLNHINTALFSLANLHKPCRRYMMFPYFPSFSPDVNGDIAKVAVHVFITMIRHHHLIICVLLLPYSSSFPRSSSAVATLVSYWFSIFVRKVHFFQQEIYVCNDLCFKRSSRWGEWSFDALWLLHRQVKKSGFVSTSSWFDHVRLTLLAIVPYPLASSF